MDYRKFNEETRSLTTLMYSDKVVHRTTTDEGGEVLIIKTHDPKVFIKLYTFEDSYGETQIEGFEFVEEVVKQVAVYE